MHEDALVLIGLGLALLVLAAWNSFRRPPVIGSDVRLSSKREADFDQEWP
jgi:hypothetical protein